MLAVRAGSFRRVFARFSAVECHEFCGGDDCARYLGSGGHKNLSGGISWLTFCVLKKLLPLGERTTDDRLHNRRLCFQGNPSSVRCSDQSAGSRDACRINFMALSCGGCRPLIMAAVKLAVNPF